MLENRRIREAEANVKQYLEEGLLKREGNQAAKEMYLENSDLSLETAHRLLPLESENYRPYLWVIVCSYYSMFYIANAVLLHNGYRVGDRISHKVTSDALIVFIRDKLKRELLEEYENAKTDALDLISSKADSIIQSFDFERMKRSAFQYSMDERAKKEKAMISLDRARRFVFEMKKLMI